jgi:predicted ABC-type ATPase
MSARLYIVAGCNGAGKTTASFSLLPEILDCEVFINADEIARELNPENVARVAFEAGRMMLEQINERIRNGETFAFETTLAARSYKETILLAQAMGFLVTLIYFWLDSPEMAITRVKKRVEEGGHHIETEVIRRRYTRGLQNLFSIYLPLATEYLIYDNSNGKPELVVARQINQEIQINNSPLWEKLKQIAHKKN